MHLRSAPGCSFMDQPIYKWMRKTGIEHLEALCTARNLYDGYAKILSPEYQEALYSFHHPMRFAESVLSLICADPSNNAIRFQMEYFPRRIRFGTAHALLDLSSAEARSAGLSRHYSKPHPEDPADVQRTVLEQIGNCINGIADPALRQDFITRFIPEKLSLALGLKDDPPCSD